ncbi:MAG: hypothetical protein IH991_13915, partial [Planctomycetes bacterium]|nr:hypothetical protein [Planctomycetota bacterium]
DGFGYALSDGILECVDLKTGKSRWKGSRDDEYDHGQILMVDDVILVLTDDGQVVMLDVNPDKQIEFGRFQAIEGKTWNNICLHGNVLLVRNSEEAAAYMLPTADKNLKQQVILHPRSSPISAWVIGLFGMGAMFLWHVFLLIRRRRPAFS